MSVLARCESHLIAICRQDDVWDPPKFAIAGPAMDDPDALLFFHDAWLIDGAGKRTWNRARSCMEIGAQARVQRRWQLRRSGVYRGASAWDFNRGALVKDAMLGVALRPPLK